MEKIFKMKKSKIMHGISAELQSIIDNTNDLMFVKNRDFIYIAASKRFAADCIRCNGVMDVIGKNDFELFKDQTIAARYREDDEKLFATGKSMVEFQETYPDQDGSNHPCLTTKYLLHDQEGNPVAIFGHYHDVEAEVETESARLRSIEKRINETLGRALFTVTYVDLLENSFQVIRSTDYGRKMLENSKTLEAGFDAFIRTLVAPEFYDQMYAFCDMTTINKRVKGEKQISCEYVSKMVNGWCRTSFYPMEWDEKGEATHLLFTISSIDAEKAKDIEAGITSRKNLEGLFDAVPSGIVIYEWDGKNLTFLDTNQYYRDLFGYQDSLQVGDEPTYSPIHTDDLPDFQKAVAKALMETHHLEYAFRIWKKSEKQYGWLQINAIAKPQKNGTSLVYAIFTDITKQKDLEQSYKERLSSLEKTNEDAMCMCDINLTQNQYSNFYVANEITFPEKIAGDLDEFLFLSAEGVFDPEERQEYLMKFRRDALLDQFEQGNNHIEFEHYYRSGLTQTDRVLTVFELVRNPISGDIEGVFCAKNLNDSRFSEILLNASLEKDYILAAVIYVDTEEYYMYGADHKRHYTHKQEYWKNAHRRMSEFTDGSELENMRFHVTSEKVSAYLKSHEAFSYSFSGVYGGKKCRMECNFRYVDQKHHRMLASLRNITDEELSRQYKYDSEHDSLTGLYNRNRVFEKCRELLTAYPDEQFIMLHCDVQHFHLYNTFFGEEAGDRLLCKSADVLKQLAKEYDYMAYGRIESDVFCIFMPYREEVFESHLRLSSEELNTFSPDFPLKVAIGVYWVVDASMDIEAMFSRATIAAKSHKKNLFGIASRYDDVMDQNLKDTQQITSEMTAAIQQEQFEVFLQPKYSLRSDKMVGAEALARWRNPARGMISPGKFIPVFEQNGFITNLDRYMWEHVCQILRRWQDEGKTMYPISVNISRVSMYSHATVPFLKSLIEKYRINPKYLELELTETAYMDDPEDLKRMLKELQEFGFNILMDDFGSGYSSLNTLRDLPVDILKLDMKFLSTAQDNARGNAVLSSVVRMSKLLHLPIVAEGVETQEQADYLCSIGCEYVQGFLFAKPMPIADYEKLLINSTKQTETTEENEVVSNASVDVVLDESFYSLGVLEYDRNQFVYLRTNKKFLQEFDLIENLKPASKVFRDHMDDRNYNTLLQAFATCSEKKKDVFCSLKWTAKDGTIRTYHGYVRYHGNIGSYADLSVIFMNVTEIERVGSEEDNENIQNALEELFFCNFYIRLCDYSFKVYKAQPYMTELLESCGNAIDAVNSYIKYMVADGSKEEMKVFLDMTTLQQRMKEVNILEHIYHDPNIGWSKAVFTVVDRNELGDAETVALIVEEISQEKEMSMVETHLQHSLELESELWNSVKMLIAASDIRASTNSILQDVMKYYDADRAYIFEFDWKQRIGTNTYEICAPNVEPVIDTLQDVPLDAMEVWIDLFHKNSLIHIKDLNALVGDESRKDEYDILAAQGIQSLIATPVYFGDNLVGFLGVDNPKIKLDDTAFIEGLAFFCVNISVRERERAVLEQQNMHDPLTGAYNRYGYHEILKQHQTDYRPVVYIQIDVDNFKKLNDTYGHAFGDDVLKQVGIQLAETFRADDYVCRFGGDEFAVLLTNCNMNTWNIISDKQRMIHIRLNQILKKDIYVTLSMGISYSDSGFHEELVALADAALYKVKSDSRAGCCVFDSNHNPVYEWKDDIGDIAEINPLAQSNTGACRLELPDNDLKQGRLICNEIARVLMGFDESMTPEECFQTWLKCIDPYSIETIRKTHAILMEKGQAECTYIYNHPIQGKIMVRSGGKCVKNENGIVYAGYHQSLQGTRIVLHEDVTKASKRR